MIKESTILEDGEILGDGGNSFYPGHFVVSYSGNLYPFSEKGMLNPLDPFNLIVSLPVVGTELDDSVLNKVINTMLSVTEIRKAGFTVITRYDSGAARTVHLEDGSNKVIILGDLAKNRHLILPILSTQLSGDYDQSKIEPWKSHGFKTPPHYGINTVENTYSVNEWHGDTLVEGTKEITYYNIIGGGKKLSVKKVRCDYDTQSVDTDGDSDWEYGNVERTSYSMSEQNIEEPKPFKTKPYRGTTPEYVWQDKGEQNG